MQATYDDCNLIMKLYELRREEKMRKARDWFARAFNAGSLEEANRIAPPGSEENAYFRMVLGYWEMAASFVTSGVLNRNLFFENCGECLMVYEKTRLLLPQAREMFKNPAVGKNLEAVGQEFVEWMSSKGPEAYPAYQAMLKTMSGRTERAGH